MGAKNSIKSESTKIADQSIAPVTLLDAFGTNDNTTTSPELQERENKYGNSNEVSFDPKQYNKYISNPTSDNPNLDLERALNQSGDEQLGHAAIQFGAALAGGVLMSAGVSGDIKEGVKTAIGNENQYKNTLYDYGSELMQSAQSKFPIYQQHNEDDKATFNTDNLFDPGWWYNQMAQQGLSVGIMAYSMAESGLISAATEGAGTAEAVANSARKANILENIFSATKNSEKLKRNAALYGLVNRHNEGVMEATQTFQDTYKELLNKGVDEETARKSAAEGAALDYKANIPLAVMDAMMFHTITYNPISGGATGGIEKVLDRIPNKALRKMTAYAMDMGGEAYEEFHQQIGQNEGQNRADVLAGVKQDSEFGDRLSKYTTQSDVVNAAVGGAIGGIFLGGTGELYSHLNENKDLKSLKLQHLDFIKNIATVNTQLADEIRNADENNKPEIAMQLRRQAGEIQALQGLHLDNLLDKETAFQSYKDNLQETVSAVQNNDIDKLSELGLVKEGETELNPNIAEHIKQSVPQYLQDADNIEHLYNINKESVDRSAIIPVTSRQFHLNVLNEHLNEIIPAISELESKIPDFNNLSSDSKNVFNIKLELASLKKEERETINDLVNSTNDAQKQGLQEKLNKIQEKQTNYHQEISEISKDNSRYTNDDKAIIAAIPTTMKALARLHDTKTKLENEIVSYRKQLEVWNNTSFQKANKQGQYETLVDKADNEIELNALKTRLENNNELSTKIENKINDKLEAIKINKQQEQIVNQSNDVIAPTNLIEAFDTEQVEQENQIIPEVQTVTIEQKQRSEIANSFMQFKPVVSTQQDVSNIRQTENATIVTEDDIFNEVDDLNYDKLFDPSTASDNQKDIAKKKVQVYYESMTKENEVNPSFAELVNDVISHTSIDAIKDIYPILKYGWESNKYTPTDFKKVYSDIFESRKELARELINWGVSANQYIFSSDLVDKENDTESEDTNRETDIVTEDENGVKFISKGYRTIKSTLKFAYLHRLYEKTIQQDEEGNNIIDYSNINDEVINGDFIDSQYIMNPDSFKVGTKINVKLPEDVNKIPVSVWDKKTWNKEKSVSFENWVKANNVVIGSNEYIAKIPIFIYSDNQTKPVALVHDLDWYNPSNVGLGETPAIQAQMIKEAREELFQLRKEIYNNGGSVEAETIANDKPTGQKVTLTERIPINEANPQAQIGYVTDAQNVFTNTGVIQSSQLINDKSLKVGGNYDIRRWRTDNQGNPTYLALEVDRNKLTEQAQHSVLKALQVYLMRETSDTNIKSEINKIQSEIKKLTGLDLFKSLDLNNYLNQFIHTEDADFGIGDMNSKLARISAFIATRNISTQTPIITVHKGAIVIGKKGVNVNGKNEFMYAYPELLKGEGNGNNIIVGLLQKFQTTGFVDSFYQNVKKENLQSNKDMAFISLDGKVEKGKNYHEYLKDNFKTNVKSFNVGLQEAPVWATAYQPVINFKYAAQEAFKSTLVHEQSQKNIIPTEITPSANNEEQIKELTQQIGSREELRELGLTDKEIDEIYKDIQGEDITLYDPGYEKDTDELVNNVKKKLTTIEQLTSTNRSQLIRYIARQIEARIDAKYHAKVDTQVINTAIKDSFENIFKPKEDKLNQQKQVFNTLYKTTNNPKYLKDIELFDRQLNNIQIVRNNYDELIKEARRKEIDKYTGITEVKNKDTQEEIQHEDRDNQEQDQTDENGLQINQVEKGNEVEKNYSKTSLEENSKASVTYVLKRFIAQIPLYDNQGNEKRGFLGVVEYPGFDYYYNILGRMLTSPTDVLPDYGIMIERLETYRTYQPWIGTFIDKMNQASQQVKNSFVNGMTLHGTATNQVMFGENRKTGKKTLKIFEANANEMVRVIQENWYQQFNVTDLVTSINDKTSINIKKAELLLSQFNTWKFSKTENTLPKLQEAKQWLDEFGITLTNNTIRELMDKGYYVDEDNKPTRYSYDKMFRNSTTTNGLFGLLANKLQNLINLYNSNQSTDFTEDETLHPLNDVSGIFKKIANIEKKYSTNTSTNSHRDGEKSVYDLSASKLAVQQMLKLVTDPQYRQDKLSISFDKNSYLLNMVDQIETVAGRLKLSHGAINILKEFGKKNFQDTEMNSLSDKDHEYVKIGMFQDIQQGKAEPSVRFKIGEEEYDLPMRISTLLFPTMSDKKMTLNLRMPVLAITKKSFEINEFNDVQTITGLNQTTKDFVISQLVKPELDRIIAHHVKAKELDIHPDLLINQKDVNKGRQIFHFIPELNNVIINDGSNISLIHYIAEHADLLKNNSYHQILSLTNISEVIDNVIKKLVTDKKEIWKNNGYFIIDGKDGSINSNNLLNQAYLDTFEEKDPKLAVEIAAYDYVVNYLIGNANMHMVFDGDIANYSKDKAFSSKLFKDDSPYRPLTKDAYHKVAEVVDVNLGKRLAMLIAPGKYLANSIGDKYIQLFVKDQVTHTTNVKYLTELFHGKQSEVTTKLIEELNSSDEKIAKNANKELSNQFPNLADYFNIESTDAQEYTTAKEALDVIFRQGKMTDEQYKVLSDKIKAQQEAEKNNLPIPKEAFLTDKETKLVFTPTKPVYSDISPYPLEDNSRVTYIKSSSFPLLPQFTLGTELDKVRRAMEKIEIQTGYNVRMSYDTANKVGAVLSKNQLSIWNSDGTFKDNSINTDKIANDLMNEGSTESARILNRENFRIQQDVPYKSGKRTADTISIGTQMMKEIFGDGITDIKEKTFTINNAQLNGRELLNYYNQSFVTWIANEKSKLYDRIGIDETTGVTKDITKTIDNLHSVLIEEANTRGYPIQDIEALGVSHIKDKNGKIIGAQFTMPLWLSPNSNRYEALVNAIVTNKLIKLTLPGNSFVVGSEAGFKLQTNLEGISQSKVVYLSKFNGELKAAYTEDGKLIMAQVLAPSKFRNNQGELIDLTSSRYSYRNEEGKLMLKEDMIDGELLNNSSFRIPTSGHVSMSQIEIVGFLPVEVADLLIVPKNFTKQKGLDFDVDKENVYQLWHEVNEDGKIVRLQGNTDTDGDRNLKSKLMQNQIVETYSAILSSPNPYIQQKIQRVLSMDFARGQAELLQSLTEKGTDNTYFTPLSDEYQKAKMNLGSAGKVGIGIYSNYVVLHSLIQQSDKPIKMMTKVFNPSLNKMVRIPLNIVIGEYDSNGKLGNILTLDKSRSIADVNAERQNTATDNEKEQIMGRAHINELTINVDAILVQLGFDKGKLKDGNEISIPYFLLSQPIIKDYVTKIRTAKSITSEFDKDAELKIVDELYNKYGGEIFKDDNDGSVDARSLSNEELQTLREKLTSQTLYDNITKNTNEVQQTILQLFLELNSYSDTFATLQSKLNIQRSGLGKSAFEMISKYDNVGWFKYNDKIDNVNSLVGDFMNEEQFDDSTKEDRLKDGFIDFNGFALKPTTPVGSILANGTKAGYELWSGFFPHNNVTIAKEITQTVDLFGDDMKERKSIELKQEIFNEMKKYLFSSEKLGLFNGNPQQERYRLFIDSKDNTSLANYLSKLSYDEEFKYIIKDNKLLSNFTYKLEKNELPSLIKYNNTDSEDFNEEYKYQALIELMEMKANLPSYNDIEDYDTRKLARDLINYTYLSGGIQKAIEFVKYVPIAYLQEIGFTQVAQQWQQHANTPSSELWKQMLGFVDTTDNKLGWVISRFGRQFAQHHPEKFTKVVVDQMSKKSRIYKNKATKLQELLSFEILNEAKPKPFVSVYNKDIKKGSKFQLYQYDGQKYQRINVLGTFGMDEYSIRDNNVKSLLPQIDGEQVINQQPIKPENGSLPIIVGREKLFDIDKGDLKSTLKQIEQAGISNISIVAKLLEPYIKQIPLLTETLTRGRGEYDLNNNQITIDRNYLNDKYTTHYMVARTILHEAVHSITARELAKYFNLKDSTLKVPIGDLPNHITKLHRVFIEVQRKMAKEIAELQEYYTEEKKGTVSKESDRLSYGAMSIFEFSAMIMSEPEFQAKMDTFRYKQTDNTLLGQFIEAIKELLQIVGINFRKDSLAVNGIDAVIRLVDATSNQEKIEAVKSAFGNTVNINQQDLNQKLEEPKEDWRNTEKENKSDCPF